MFFSNQPKLDSFKYTLNVDQWREIIRDSKESKQVAYELYKLYVNSKPTRINSDCYYTREEFDAEYDTHKAFLKPLKNSIG